MKRTKNLVQLLGEKNAKRLPDTLADLSRMSSDDMVARGVPRRDALRIVAAIGLAREIHEPEEGYDARMRITSPATAMRFCQQQFTALKHAMQEEFWMVTLDTKNQPIATHRITVGTLRNSLVHPREVFRPAIADAANCILVVHNHPSGDPTPSDQDLSVTERLENAAEIIGIPVLDHIVIAGDRSISIQEWKTR
jgi:DNA repair protein RadC